MTDCICGNHEGTNKECERCRLIAEIERLQPYENAVEYLRNEFDTMDLTDQSSLAMICRKADDQICFCSCHISYVPDYVSPEQQKLNDAMERGDYLRDRAKDERVERGT